MLLTATRALVATRRREMGDYAFVRFCRDLGIPFEDCYEMMFGHQPPVTRQKSDRDLAWESARIKAMES